MIKKLTLIFLVKDGQVLLGMKKRGFGAGWWNGFGGKVQEGESIADAAKRELQEEASVEAKFIQERGKLLFTFDDNQDTLEVNVFQCLEWTGVPTESEEMKPQWFDFEKIPFENMWPDDKFWLPKFLKGENISGKFHFKADKSIGSYSLS